MLTSILGVFIILAVIAVAFAVGFLVEDFVRGSVFLIVLLFLGILPLLSGIQLKWMPQGILSTQMYTDAWLFGVILLLVNGIVMVSGMRFGFRIRSRPATLPPIQ